MYIIFKEKCNAQSIILYTFFLFIILLVLEKNHFEDIQKCAINSSLALHFSVYNNIMLYEL